MGRAIASSTTRKSLVRASSRSPRVSGSSLTSCRARRAPPPPRSPRSPEPARIASSLEKAPRIGGPFPFLPGTFPPHHPSKRLTDENSSTNLLVDMKTKTRNLTEQELEIMKVVWERKASTVREVYEVL